MDTKPEKPMALQIRDAVRNLQRMSSSEKIQLLVVANLMTQEEADKAKERLRAEGREG